MINNLLTYKTGKALGLLAALALPLLSQGQTGFVCGGGNVIEILPGEPATLALSLDGAERVLGFRADISLPAGMSVPVDGDSLEIGLGAGNDTHCIDAAKVDGVNRYRVVAYSTVNTAFAEGDGLLRMRLVADDGFNGGIITIDRVKLSLSAGESVAPDPLAVTVRRHVPPQLSASASVSRTKVREGSVVTLTAQVPDYDNADGWTCQWAIDGALLSDEPECEAALTMAAGDGKATEQREFTFTANKLTPSGLVWASASGSAAVTVYRAPQTPHQLVRKGDGTTNVLVAMTAMSDAALAERGYTFVFGYDDRSGARQTVASSAKRYARYEASIYDDAALRKWCYTSWTYPDGSTVTSGLRYLDGAEDAAFDASTFDGQPKRIAPMGETIITYAEGHCRIEVSAEDDTLVELYDCQGRLAFRAEAKAGCIVDIAPGSLPLGVYIVRVGDAVAKAFIK